MKKCPVCTTGKARRECLLKDRAIICSRCCAETRGTECGDCPHYIEALRHAMKHGRELSSDHFIAEINPEVQEAVDGALDLAIQGNTVRAFEEMKRLTDKNPKNHDACYGMGTLLAISEKHAESIPWFQKAITIFPIMGEAYYNLAIAYQKSYNLGQMIKALRKAVEHGDSTEEYYQSARKQLQTVAQVISENEGVSLDDYVASSEQFEAAFELMEEQQWASALKGFKAAASLNERNAPTHGNMGICLIQLGRKAEALAAFERALKINPKYEPAIDNRRIAEGIEEGVPPEKCGFESINYAAEQLDAKRRCTPEPHP